MRASVNLSQPADLRQWVEEQVEAGGYDTAAEYLRDLLRRARERQARRELDATLVEAAAGGAEQVMDDADWASIRKAARTQARRTHRGRWCGDVSDAPSRFAKTLSTSTCTSTTTVRSGGTRAGRNRT